MAAGVADDGQIIRERQGKLKMDGGGTSKLKVDAKEKGEPCGPVFCIRQY